MVKGSGRSIEVYSMYEELVKCDDLLEVYGGHPMAAGLSLPEENLELFEFAPKVRTPAEYGRYMIQDSGHYEYDPNLEEFYDYERYGKLRMEKETGAFTEKGYVAYCGTLTLGELMAGGPAEQHQREQEFQMGGM